MFILKLKDNKYGNFGNKGGGIKKEHFPEILHSFNLLQNSFYNNSYSFNHAMNARDFAGVFYNEV